MDYTASQKSSKLPCQAEMTEKKGPPVKAVENWHTVCSKKRKGGSRHLWGQDEDGNPTKPSARCNSVPGGSNCQMSCQLAKYLRQFFEMRMVYVKSTTFEREHPSIVTITLSN